MAKTEEIEELTLRLRNKGMDYDLAKKNLLECDRYFIEGLGKII